MKKIKKLTFLFCLMSTMTFANDGERDFQFFSGSSSESKAADPDVFGTDDDPAAPIDDYLPLLVIGAGIVALRFRKQLLKK